MHSFFEAKPARILLLLLLFMASLALGGYARLAFTQAEYIHSGPPTISVSGEGEAVALPDVAKFSFAVTAEADSAAEAQNQAATTMNDIKTYLTEAGVEERDIKTEQYNLSPRWRFEERICPAGSFCPPGKRVQDGFSLTERVEVTVRNLDDAGAFLSGVGERGATNISSLSFTVDDTDTVRAEARAAAIADAQAKAAAIAESLGVRIERMTGFYIEDMGRGPVYGYGGDMARAEMAEMSVAPDIQPGETTMTERVNITYQVR